MSRRKNMNSNSNDTYDKNVSNEYHKRYEGFRGLYFKFLETNLVLKGLGTLTRNKSVLDIGMGSGRMYPIFKDMGIEYQGIDLSEDMILAAKEMFPEIQANRLDYMESETSDVQKYDYVIAIGTLEYISPEDLDKHLEIINSYIKPSGQACITVYSKNAMWRINKCNTNIHEHDEQEILTSLSRFVNPCQIKVRSTFHVPNKFIWNAYWIFSKFLGEKLGGGFVVLSSIVLQSVLAYLFKGKGNELIVSWGIMK